MSIELARNFLLWCTVINYGILLVWFLVFTLAHDWMRGPSTAVGFVCPTSSSTPFTTWGCQSIRSEFFCST